jgi:hypothetical protein
MKKDLQVSVCGKDKCVPAKLKSIEKKNILYPPPIEKNKKYQTESIKVSKEFINSYEKRVKASLLLRGV